MMPHYPCFPGGQVTILWCKNCGRYLQPPKHWLKADLGAQPLLPPALLLPPVLLLPFRLPCSCSNARCLLTARDPAGRCCPGSAAPPALAARARCCSPASCATGAACARAGHGWSARLLCLLLPCLLLPCFLQYVGYSVGSQRVALAPPPMLTPPPACAFCPAHLSRLCRYPACACCPAHLSRLYRCPAESKELLTYCIKRVKGLQKVKLVDASFVWTEPHR